MDPSLPSSAVDRAVLAVLYALFLVPIALRLSRQGQPRSDLADVVRRLLVVGGELRGRAEEKVLRERFGERYESYARRVRRLIPWVY